MSSVCKVILVGRVGRDPELRHMTTGKAVVNMTIATSTKRRGPDGQTEETLWHKVTMYDKLAEIAANYARKGVMIYVEGTIRYGKYIDKNGAEKDTTDIIANNMQLLSRANDDERRNHENEQRSHTGDGLEDSSDLPF